MSDPEETFVGLDIDYLPVILRYIIINCLQESIPGLRDRPHLPPVSAGRGPEIKILIVDSSHEPLSSYRLTPSGPRSSGRLARDAREPRSRPDGDDEAREEGPVQHRQ